MHVSTRSCKRAASGIGWAYGRRCRFVQRRAAPAWPHGPRSRLGPLPAAPAARCWSRGVADGVVHQVGPSGTACGGSSKLVKAHTPRRGRPSCRNTFILLITTTKVYGQSRGAAGVEAGGRPGGPGGRVRVAPSASQRPYTPANGGEFCRRRRARDFPSPFFATGPDAPRTVTQTGPGRAGPNLRAGLWVTCGRGGPAPLPQLASGPGWPARYPSRSRRKRPRRRNASAIAGRHLCRWPGFPLRSLY
jgi:hypothetical protein